MNPDRYPSFYALARLAAGLARDVATLIDSSWAPPAPASAPPVLYLGEFDMAHRYRFTLPPATADDVIGGKLSIFLNSAESPTEVVSLLVGETVERDYPEGTTVSVTAVLTDDVGLDSGPSPAYAFEARDVTPPPAPAVAPTVEYLGEFS